MSISSVLFPQQRYQYDARQREYSLRRGDQKAQPRRRGHLHVAGPLERAVKLERRANGRGRVLRCVALNRELLGGWGLGLVEAAEAVAVGLHDGIYSFSIESTVLICFTFKEFCSTWQLHQPT